MGTLLLSFEQESPHFLNIYSAQSITMAPFPDIKSKHSLTAKHVTAEKWAKLGDHVTKTSGFTLAKAIACAVDFDNQHCGIYAGDWDSYKDFANVFDPLIQEYHGISADAKHTSDMDVEKVVGNINPEVPVHSTRIRVGRNINGFGLSPGITKQQRIDVEKLMSNALSKLTGDLAGKYYPLTGMDEAVRQQLVDDHFLFVTGPRVVESSTTTPRPSCSGSTRRTRPASSPWRRAVTSRESSLAWPAASRPSRSPSRRSPARSTLCPSSTATSTPAPPTSVPA